MDFSPTAAVFRTPPTPTMKPYAPSETLFRLLCPGDRATALVGPGGSVIRQICESTGSRIRIDDPVPGSADRVVLIAADSNPRKEATEEVDASPVQRALLRVFERVLGVEGEEGKEIEGQVVCRMLAPSSQVGCVLGRGGRIVEKMRQDSGAQIRVIGKEQVPMCASAGDELIQISGSFHSVIKALLSVSRCLQENPRSELMNFLHTKPLGATVCGIGSATMDPYSARNYLPSHVPDYHSRNYPTNMGSEFTASSHRLFTEQEVMFRMLCANDKVGSIIGKAGVIIRALQSDTGASIKVVDPVSDSDERAIVISARENSGMKHSPAQDAVLRVHSRLTDVGNDKGCAVSARLLVPAQQIGCLLGKGGTIIAEMRKATGANIRIFIKEQVPKCAQANDEVVQVTGSMQSVQEALVHITGRIREIIIPIKTHLSGGTTQFPPTAADSTALLRSRQDPSFLGHSTRPDPALSLSHPSDLQSPLLHDKDCLGVDRLSYSHVSGSTEPRPFMDHPAARSWTPEVPNCGILRSNSDLGANLGFKGATKVAVTLSESETAVPGSKTTEVIVPYQYLDFVYGENGNDLAEIRKISGAKVTIQDPKPGEPAGTVVICGSPDQIKMAQSLLHAFILCGVYPS